MVYAVLDPNINLPVIIQDPVSCVRVCVCVLLTGRPQSPSCVSYFIN